MFSSYLHMRSHFFFFVAGSALALLSGCAAGSEDTIQPPPGSGGAAGAPSQGGSGGTGGSSGGGGGEGGQGGAGGSGLSGDVELCVLNEGGPYDPCQQPEELDYGVVSSGTAEMRMFRILNGTEEDLLFKSADISDPKFDVQAVRFEEDPGDPGEYLRVEVTLPVTRDSGEALWFEVEYTAGGGAGPIPELDVIVKLNVGDNPIPDIVVPVTGEESGCPPGLGACDADPTNGCETNTQTSLDHCGQCGNPCVPFNGTGECVGGVCELTGCDPYHEDCDSDPTTGCEAPLLSDPLNCGGCNVSCMKANTTSFCNGGNCNIMGCLNNYGDCNLIAIDGCETNLGNTIAHCGGCNLLCDIPNATESCVPSQQTGLGVCTFGACTGSFKNCNLDINDGCEVDSSNDVNNCSSCFNQCNFANAAESCVNSTCVMGNCDVGFDDCDNNPLTGCEVNLQTTTANCGSCGNNCAAVYPNSNVSCSGGGCNWGGCLPNYHNLDGSLVNGCEYFCVAQAGADLPDNGFTDSNCDGIDGDASQAIFVATSGNDAWPGTMQQPMLTVTAALGKALADGKSQVYVSNGTYNGRVNLINGISLYGGYSASNGWARSAAYVAVLQSTTVSNGRMSAVEGVNITTPTVVDRFSIATASTNMAGISNYGVHCSGCTALTLRNNTITPGNAGPGSAGSSGASGANGVVGSPGLNGTCDGGHGNGGPGGSSTCGRPGGNGGRGGTEGDNNGIAGSTGQIGTPGGPGGGGGDPGGAGSPGQGGTNGTTGGFGSAGSGGTGISGVWVTANGGSGGLGTHGNGGGGGGGGGGQGCFFCNDGGGNGAGGGGGGGCGGGGGGGGIGGGGSFGIFLVGSTGIVLTNNSVFAGNGGSGGAGGSGGGGGVGANGGAGATNCTGEIGAGGNGGKGGNGGLGGGGGGGAGGPSYGLYRTGTTVSLAGNNISAGNGGSGGPGGFPNGAAGVAGAAINAN